ncbi:hypothetical protein M3P05_13715 [Sansalvadorimonas sp. 2012CJ34-2]|uniref:Uncharacterized protein n=1 Tax=Parendozoicomonas callyspongiae TaxID=2942213 RepID=A0ABT0PI21_9GAMM|nr:hypothetical protein [Sansalvadorimonas sp. 2012CJ34-2]MCL6270983.1 hypothetical protein [Sansalvadorimonas sp. 2012CJ34-2]
MDYLLDHRLLPKLKDADEVPGVTGIYAFACLDIDRKKLSDLDVIDDVKTHIFWVQKKEYDSEDSQSRAGLYIKPSPFKLLPKYKQDESILTFDVPPGYDEFNRYSREVLHLARNGHNKHDMKQLFMFGTNYARLLDDVIKKKQHSETFCFVNPLMFNIQITAAGRACYIIGHGQRLYPEVDSSGKVCKVIQRDPEYDAHPCGIEYHITPSYDDKIYSRIEFKSKDRPDIVACAQRNN